MILKFIKRFRHALLEIKLKKYDRKNRKHTFVGEIGVDHYTSASSDKINPSTISSASSADTRVYPSLNWAMENEIKGSTFGVGISGSAEYDYTSIGANLSYAKKTKNKSGEFSGRLQAYIDQVTLIKPIELRPARFPGNNNDDDDDDDDYGIAARNTIAASLSYSQIISQRLQVAFLVDIIHQQGYLGLPFHRIYFLNNTVAVENLPSTRIKLPIGFRANYFAGDKVIIKTYYRYYQDDWGLKAHTVNLEVPVKITPFFSVSPFYRYYQQQGVKYFAPYQKHTPTETYFTSNYDLSTFIANFYGAGLRLAPPENVFGIKHLASLELRYGHYTKNIGMQSDVVSLHLGVK